MICMHILDLQLPGVMGHIKALALEAVCGEVLAPADGRMENSKLVMLDVVTRKECRLDQLMTLHANLETHGKKSALYLFQALVLPSHHEMNVIAHQIVHSCQDRILRLSYFGLTVSSFPTSKASVAISRQIGYLH